ncbi:MAG: type II secretion system protein [Planctomycetes bacterium]|nr:type II secretion system protein [Planctomycetota bacterium]
MDGRHVIRTKAFTLIELLVVVAILALLTGILLPSVSRAKRLAKITKAHAELRGITMAIEMYRQVNHDHIPPTRFSCSSRTAYDLPVELTPFLPSGRRDNLDVIAMPDPFVRDQTYRYRAVGPGILNESTLLANASTLWIPDGFGGEEEADTGRYHSDPRTSPVLYAVWSMGPAPASALFDIPGRLPLPQKYWLKSGCEAGVIVHYQDASRQLHMSP